MSSDETDPRPPPAGVPQPPRECAPPYLTLQPGDRYLDGSYWVFTRQYLLRRGYCCGNGCRHCPYRDDPA